MKTPTVADVNTPAVYSLVRSYLLARAYAETMRARVDEIQRAILEECPLPVDPEWLERTPGWFSSVTITEPKHSYLGTDEACADYYAECNARERAAGLKPDDMPDDRCPALVAESMLTDAENALIEESGRPFGVTNHKLLCCRKGLETRQRWIDLITSLIVSTPEFVPPVMPRPVTA